MEGDAFADIRVQVKQGPPYFIEVKYGYSPNEILTSLTRKYGPARPPVDASKVIVVVDPQTFCSWAELGSEIQGQMQEGLQLEVWDESVLVSMLRKCFQIEIDAISEKSVLKICDAVDRAKGRYAFEDTWTDDELQRTLMWHYGFWRLKQLRDDGRLDSRTIMPPGQYERVVVVMADLCGFSSYVRDTRKNDIIRDCLTTFYAKARYEILNTGGMMYQFVGDEVIGLLVYSEFPASRTAILNLHSIARTP